MSRELFIEYRNTKSSELKEQLISEHIKLVKYIARKFANRGEPLEDVIQVGTMGLLKAIDRYDPDQEIEFATYATPTIVGEIKHFFRDKTHLIKIPRRLHELYAKIKKTIYEYSRDNGKSPTIEVIAQLVGATEEEVLESLEAGQAYSTISLDAPIHVSERSGDSSDSKMSLMDSIKKHSVDNYIINRESLRSAIVKSLNRREQRIIYLRFYDNLSQSEIAEHLKLSQMHVSRLLSHSLKKLRDYMAEG